jgi:uncharacterized membrane protein
MSFILEVIHDLVFKHHPHTMFVHFPIALVSAALFFMLLALWFKKDILEQIAFANISLAAVSTLAAGTVGILDNFTFYLGNAANNVVKIILASFLFVVTSATAILRWRYPSLFHGKYKAIYVASYFFCFALVAVLGFLGGVIVHGF